MVNPAFKTLSQLVVMEGDYRTPYHQKRSLNSLPNIKQDFKPILIGIFSIILFVIIHIYNSQTFNYYNVFIMLYELLGINFYFGTHAIKNSVDYAKKIIKITFYNKEFIKKYEIYLNKCDECNVDVMNSFMGNLTAYLSLIEDYHSDESIKNIGINNKIHNLDFLLTLSKKIIISEKSKIIQMIPDIDNFINDYRSIKNELKSKIIIPFLQNMISKNKIKITPIFLSGSPGTGKTRFVNNISKLLDAFVIDYKKIKNNGSSSGNSPEDKINIEKVNHLTKIKYDSIVKNNNNYILFIDEFDKKIIGDNKKQIDSLLMDRILEILNENSIMIYDEHISSYTSIKNIFVICASNKNLEELSKIDDRFIPFSSRVIEIPFPNIPSNTKIEILVKQTKIIFEERKLLFSDDDYKFIEDLISVTKYDGVRELLNIMNIYINEIYSYYIFAETIWKVENLQEIRDKMIKEHSQKNENERNVLNELHIPNSS